MYNVSYYIMLSRLYNENTDQSKFYISNCNLTSSEKKILRKNPHCTEFFCTLKDDIKDCTQCYNFLKDKMMMNFKDKFDDRFKNVNYDHKYCENNCSKGFLYNYIIGPNDNDDDINIYDNENNQMDKIKLNRNHKVKSIIYKYSDLNNELPKDIIVKYDITYPRPKTVVHWGQLKLLLTTIVFLMRVTEKNDKNVVLIYAGSATGDATNILIDMFPYIEWYLIDPRKHNKYLYKNKKVKEIRKEYFTDKTAKYYSDKFHNRKHKLLFMSDIREGTEDEKIIDNQQSQVKWHKIIKPDYSYLKFRCPYEIQKDYDYYDGEIFLQFYAPLSSTETRILFKNKLTKKKYNSDEFQGKMSFFNRVIRPGFHKSLIKENDIFDNCYDCVYFGYIIKNYLKKFIEITPFFDKDTKIPITDIFIIMKIIINKIGNKAAYNIKNYNEYIRKNIF